MENKQIPVFGQVEQQAVKSNIQLAFDMIDKYVTNVQHRADMSVEIGKLLIAEYKRGFNDCSGIYNPTCNTCTPTPIEMEHTFEQQAKHETDHGLPLTC